MLIQSNVAAGCYTPRQSCIDEYTDRSALRRVILGQRGSRKAHTGDRGQHYKAPSEQDKDLLSQLHVGYHRPISRA